MTKSVAGALENLATWTAILNPDQTTLFFEFDVRGLNPVKLIARIYEDETMANLLATLYAEDANSPQLPAGVSGLAVVTSAQGLPWPTPPAGTYDLVASQIIPEPATLSLLALGGLGALLRRRRR